MGHPSIPSPHRKVEVSNVIIPSKHLRVRNDGWMIMMRMVKNGQNMFIHGAKNEMSPFFLIFAM